MTDIDVTAEQVDSREFDLLCKQLGRFAMKFALHKLARHGFYGTEPVHETEAPHSLEELQNAVDTKPFRGLFPVSMDYSEKTIFEHPHINMMGRVWHDLLHYELAAPFNTQGELAVAQVQVQDLLEAGGNVLHAKLLTIDVVGQNEYFEKWGHYPDDQKEFVRDYFNYGRDHALRGHMERIGDAA
jgi:hypothetical protein